MSRLRKTVILGVSFIIATFTCVRIFRPAEFRHDRQSSLVNRNTESHVSMNKPTKRYRTSSDYDFHDEDYEDDSIIATYRLDDVSDRTRKWYNYYPFDVEKLGFRLRNQHACDHSKPQVVVMVTSAPGNFLAREQYRRTWGSIKRVLSQRILTLFITALTKNVSLQRKIDSESQKYGDLVQGDFQDSYYNLTLKTLSAFKWVSQNCASSGFLVKTDDDMLVNYRNLISYLMSVQRNKANSLYTGQVTAKTRPIRNRLHKWFVSIKEYGEDFFPPYAKGPCYIVSTKLAGRMFLQAKRESLFPFEDVFVGILSRRLKVEPLHSSRFCPIADYDYCRFRFSYISVHYLSADQRSTIWTDMTSRKHAKCKTENYFKEIE